jgi:hypothetical protein
VKEFWDEFKREAFTLHAMLFTTTINNPAHHNLSSQSKKKGAACPHCLEETCLVWLRNSRKFMGGHCFLDKKHEYQAMDCQFDGQEEDREAPLHVTRDLVHLKVKNIKTIEELPKLTEKPLAKEKMRW